MSPGLLVLRVALLGCVAGAAGGWSPLPGMGQGDIVQVIDASASVGEASPAAPPPAFAGTTGQPELWVADGHAWRMPGQPVPRLPRGASGLGAALMEVAQRRPGAHVLLESDGRATDDLEAGVRAVLASGGRVWTRPPARAVADVGLLHVRLASGAQAGRVVLEASVASSVRGAVRLCVEGGRERVLRELAVEPGSEQPVRLEVPVAGLPATLEARLEAAPGTPDDVRGNNRVVLVLPSERRTLALVGDLPVDLLAAALEGLEVRQHASVAAAVASAPDLLVLAGVPWADVGVEGVARIEELVARGTHLLLLGGARGYARGGWGGTALERRLSPLRVAAPPGRSAAWVLALDASGSTAGAPAQALAGAALEALASLQPGERLCVLPFRAAAAAAPLAPGWIEAGDVAAGSRLRAALAALVSQGPTDLGGGIVGGVQVLEAQPPGRTRCLLLLTDGDPDERLDPQALAGVRARVEQAGVRFSALVVGMREAVEALRRGVARRPEHVALLGGSEALVPSLLEQLARERAALEQESLGAGWLAEPLLPGWASTLEAIGPLDGLHAVEPVPEATLVALARPAGPGGSARPLAAQRSVGSGEVHGLAWGPLPGEQAQRAVPGLAGVMRELAESSQRALEAEVLPDGVLRVAWPQVAGSGRAVLRTGTTEHGLLEVAPGVFQGMVPALAAGAGPAPGSSLRAGSASRPVRGPAMPDAEHRGVGVDLERLRQAARAGGGELVAAGSAVPVPLPGRGWPTPAAWLLLAATLLVAERVVAWRAARRPRTESA